MNNQSDKKDKIAALLNKSDDELLYELGVHLSRKKLGAAPLTNKQLIDNAKKWLKKRRSELKKYICNSSRVVKYLSSDSNEGKVELAAIIGDIIAEKYSGVPVLTISVLLVKEGIKALCEEL